MRVAVALCAAAAGCARGASTWPPAAGSGAAAGGAPADDDYYDDDGDGWDPERPARSNRVTATVLLLVASIAVVRCHERLHRTPLGRCLSEHAVVALAGAAVGAVMYAMGRYSEHGAFVFNEAVFNTFVLPPVAFHLGYNLRHRFLADHLRSAAFFAVGCTLLSVAAMGTVLYWAYPHIQPNWKENHDPDAHALRQFIVPLSTAVALSATEPAAALGVLEQHFGLHRGGTHVPPLYVLLLAEGIFSDVFSFVSYQCIWQMPESVLRGAGSAGWTCAWWWVGSVTYSLALGGLLGVALGVAASLVLRHVDLRGDPPLELAALTMLGFGSFFAGQYIDENTPAIVPPVYVTFVCGLVMGQFCWPNVSVFSRVSFPTVVRGASLLAELYTYSVLGSSSVALHRRNFAARYAAVAFGAMQLARLAAIAALAPATDALLRRECGGHRLSWRAAAALFVAGTKGHIAYGIAAGVAEGWRTPVLTTTWAAVAFTTVVQGSAARCALRLLRQLPHDADAPPPTPPAGSGAAAAAAARQPVSCERRCWRRAATAAAPVLLRGGMRGVDRHAFRVFVDERIPALDAEFRAAAAAPRLTTLPLPLPIISSSREGRCGATGAGPADGGESDGGESSAGERDALLTARTSPAAAPAAPPAAAAAPAADALLTACTPPAAAAAAPPAAAAAPAAALPAAAPPVDSPPAGVAPPAA